MANHFNRKTALERVQKKMEDGTLHEFWDKIEPWKMNRFKGLEAAILLANSRVPESKQRFLQFLFDMRYQCRGRNPRINNNLKQVKNISEVIEVAKSHITIGLEMKSTFNNPEEYDARAKGVSFGMMTAFNGMLDDHRIVLEVLKRGGALGLPVTLHRKDFSEGPEKNPQGIVGFEIDLTNMASVNYSDIYTFALFVWGQISQALALNKVA